MKIIAFAGSNSSTSINKQLATYTAQQFKNAAIEILDLNDYKLPIFGVDLEKEIGQPENAKKFFNKIGQADLLVLSLAENNGSYSAVFKNLLDWTSRIDGNVFQNKPMLLMATSPGGRGGMSVLETAKARFPFHAAAIKGTFSLPSFYTNFVDGELINEELKKQLLEIIATISAFMNEEK